MKVLLVDDDQAVHVALKAMLELEGHHVEDTWDGKDALDALIHARFDVVIADLQRPDQEGSTIQEIRKLDATLPIVAISDRVAEPGADVTLLKPFTSLELRWAVKRALCA